MLAIPIADYLINAMVNAPTLDAVRLFIRGYAPMDVPHTRHPYMEVVVAEDVEGEGGGTTGGILYRQYAGVITVNTLLTLQANRDWLDPNSAQRTASVPSYDQVVQLLEATINLFEQPAYENLGEMVQGREAVVRFALTTPIVLGLSDTEKENTWQNFGSIPFTVDVNRLQEAP